MKNTLDNPDHKDMLMNDGAALQTMYAEFVEEESQLAQVRLVLYARTLDEEETRS